VSTFSQNPEPATTFAEIVAEIAQPSLWKASFEAAEDFLQETRPDGFEIEEIGRTAWDMLPEGDQPAAKDELFYTYWSAQQNDREELARYEREHAARATLRARLDEYETLTQLFSPVTRELVTEIASLARTIVGGAL
jgi:hypothetical protein